MSNKLAVIQQALKAPKSQFNKFGKYQYRNCEDILEGLKPLLGECVVLLNDSIEMVGDRVYVKATASFIDGDNKVEVNAYAREALTKKGMDDSQITGTASSYARKYALNGLFLIDDTKDADSHDNSQKIAEEQPAQLKDIDKQWIEAVKKDPLVLNQIADPVYKSFIATQVMEK